MVSPFPTPAPPRNGRNGEAFAGFASRAPWVVPDVSALLVGNYAPLLQPSMARYARGLAGAMAAIGVDAPLVEGRDLVSARTPRKLRRFAHVVGRHLAYPLALGRRRPVRLAHVLDHSNALLHRRVRADVRVTTCHDLIPLLLMQGELPGSTMGKAARAHFRYVLEELTRSDAIVCDSESTRRDVVERLGYPIEQTSVVFLGVEPQFSPAPVPSRARGALGEKRRACVLTVGGGLPYKNTEGLLRAARLLIEGGIDLELVVIGRELTAAQRRLVAGSALEPRLQMLGSVDEASLVQWYRRADVFAFPSFYEGFGWPPLEAMACGCPVVTTRRGSLAELAAPHARVVDPLSPGDIAQGIADVLAAPEVWRGRAADGARRIKSLTWTATAQQVAAVWQRVSGTSFVAAAPSERVA